MFNIAQYIVATEDNGVSIKIPVDWMLHTDGRGYWSNVAKPVRVTALTMFVGTVKDEDGYYGDGDLGVHYDTATWDNAVDGLIYTDKLFMDELRTLLAFELGDGAVADTVDYSEQGMQGVNYVSMDVGEMFMRELEPMFRWTINKSPLQVA